MDTSFQRFNTQFDYVFAPAQSGEAGTTLLLLHGTGGDEQDLLALGSEIAPGAALLSPRGRVLENGAPRFFRRLAEGVFDIEDLKFRTHELADFVRTAAAHYKFDANKVVALGFSNGANIAASLLVLEPDVLAGAILLRPMIPLRPDSKPELSGKRIFISAGRRDALVDPAQTTGLERMFNDAGAQVTLNWQNAGHGLLQADLVQAKEWFAQQAF